MLIARFLREVLTPEEAAADKEGYEADAPTDGGPDIRKSSAKGAVSYLPIRACYWPSTRFVRYLYSRHVSLRYSYHLTCQSIARTNRYSVALLLRPVASCAASGSVM